MTRSTKHLENEQRHATKVVGDKVVWTGAKDANGDPVEPTTDDLARLGGEKFRAHQQWVRDEKEKRRKARSEEASFEAFKKTFVAQGGKPAEARSHYEAHKNQRAAEVAAQADSAALTRTRARTRSRL